MGFGKGFIFGGFAGMEILADKLEERKLKKFRGGKKLFAPTEFEKDKRMPYYFKRYIKRRIMWLCEWPVAKEAQNEQLYGMARRYFNKETGIFDEEKFLKEHPEAKNPKQSLF